MKKIFLFFVAALLVGCTDYTDDFNAIDERLDKIEQAVPSIEEQIESISTQLVSLKETDEAIKAQIAELENSDKATAAEIADLKTKDSALEKAISDLQKYVDTQISNAKSEAAAAYATIEQYNTIVAQLSALQASTNKLGEDLTAKIDAEVKKLNDKIADLENRLKAVEEKVEKLLARIQSISYIPEYEDGKVKIERLGYMSAGELSFRISPNDAIAELAKVWESAVSCEAYYPKTRAVSLIKLAVTEFVGDAENGVVTVKVSGEGLSDEFFAGTQEAKVALAISDGNNQIISDYADTFGYEITNEIWYTTTDGNILSPNNEGIEIFGANIVSNTYENGKGVIKFDGPVTMVGNKAFGISSIGEDPEEEEEEEEEDASEDTTVSNTLSSIILPNSVTSIGERAFRQCCDELVSIVIPNSVRTIGINAFAYSDKLETVIFGCNLEYIASSVFYECKKIKGDIILPPSLKHLGKYAFKGCSNITSVTLSDNLESVGENPFCYCSNNQSFYGKYASADNRCFIFNKILESVARKDLISIDIPEGVTTVAYKAFHLSSTLKTVTIPTSVNYLKGYSLYNCNNLTVINCKALVPPTANDKTFKCSKLKTINVPTESVEAYKAATGWEKYADKIVGYDF